MRGVDGSFGSKALRERANPAKAGGIQAYSGMTLKAPPKTWQKPASRGGASSVELVVIE